MKHFCFFLLTFFAANFLHAQQTWQWAHEAGGGGNDLGYALTTDRDGYSYVTGRFNAIATFGAFTVTSAGGPDIFIAKYSPSGICLWARRVGSSNTSDIYGDEGRGIDLDSAGNCYVTGNFSGYGIFGNDTLGSPSYSGRNVFLVKYDSNGNEIWARAAANNGTQNNYSRAVSTDPAGNSWITGYLGGGVNTFGSFSVNGAGGYAVKYDANGNAAFATKLGGGAIDLYGVANDNNGNSYVTGYLQGSDMIGSQTFTSTLDREPVLIKLDASGAFSWLRQGSGLAPSSMGEMAFANAVCCDPQNGIYICGYADKTIVFGNDTINVTGVPMSREIYVVKYDAAGNAIWKSQSVQQGFFSGGQFDALAITADQNSNVYITGVFMSDITFGIQQLNNNSTGMNTYIVMFEPIAGVCQFAIASTGQNPGAFGQGIGTDDLGGTYITGYDKAPVVFGNYTTAFIGGEDAFIAKLSQGKENGINEPVANDQVKLWEIDNAFHLVITDENMLAQKPVFVLYDVAGRIVKQLSVNYSGMDISKEGLAPGIYYWQLENGSQRFAAGKISTF